MNLPSNPLPPGAAVVAPLATWTRIAQRYLSLSLQHDYLSSGRGHRQSRALIGERMARARADLLPMAAAGVADGSAERRYLAEVAAMPRLASHEEYRLASRVRRGDRLAFDRLVESHLGLVVMFARRYQRPGIPLLDLVAEGNFGLMRAAERFDPERGFRFATCAKWWVRQAIQQALPKLASVVRIPIAQAGPAAGHDPAPEDVAGGAPPDMPGPDPLNPATPERMPPAARETGDPAVLEAIAIDTDQEPPGQVMARQRLAVLQSALDGLGERDRCIVVARYALEGDRVGTLDELATRFGVSIERIRQLEVNALKKLGRALIDAGQTADVML